MRLATYSDLEKSLKMPRGTLHWLVSTGAIPHVRIGPRTVRFDLDEIERWIAARSTASRDISRKPTDEKTTSAVRGAVAESPAARIDARRSSKAGSK